MKKKVKKSTAPAKGGGGEEHEPKTAIEKRLAKLQAEIPADSVPEGGFGDLPEGDYQVKFGTPAGTINESKSSDRLQISWDMTVISGEHKGRKVFKHDGIENEQNLSFLRDGLKRLGTEWVNNLTKLPDAIEALSGTYAQVRIKQKGEFTNVYFQKALDPDDVTDTTGADGKDGAEAEDGGWDKGSRVYTDTFGTDFVGEVTKIDEKAETAHVKFDDGDEGDFPWAEIHPAEESTEAEPEAAAEDDGGIKFTFADDDLNKLQVKKVNDIAKEYDFNSGDYDSVTALLHDIAKEFEIPATTYKTAKAVIEAITKAAEAA